MGALGESWALVLGSDANSILFDLEYLFTFLGASFSLAVKWDNSSLVGSTDNQVRKLCE